MLRLRCTKYNGARMTTCSQKWAQSEVITFIEAIHLDIQLERFEVDLILRIYHFAALGDLIF